ncbi:CAP domain-containing protein [Streptomyces sp. 8N706]|uniref:CAP domain-containing protein n=1 Tax=Streptomyces sp. 8N706 TaxID=3457416 RepID=UPI003FD084DA
MGRHRRTVPTGLPDRSAGRHRGARHVAAPVRTGLLGVSAAVAMGAVAVASGLLPGQGDDYTLGGGNDPGGRVRAGGLPDLETQGPPSATPTGRTSVPADRGSERSQGPSSLPSASRTQGRPSATTPTPQRPSTEPEDRGAGTPRPSRTATVVPEKSASAAPQAPADETGAESEVLTLVNRERARAGCRPVTADRKLAGLAEEYSEDMAERHFFDHTDPDGANPWDRAKLLGIGGLGGENIARGQGDAQAVMDAWMGSPGHRANILNCDYRTLGVGAHFADGGPWWTQDFGF